MAIHLYEMTLLNSLVCNSLLGDVRQKIYKNFIQNFGPPKIVCSYSWCLKDLLLRTYCTEAHEDLTTTRSLV